jgi:hypothetical protein
LSQPPPSPSSLRDVYAEPAVKQLQSELRHIVERALKDPSNKAARMALDRKHQEMESLVQIKVAGAANDDAKVNYDGGRGVGGHMKIPPRRSLLCRRWTDGTVPLGKSV